MRRTPGEDNRKADAARRANRTLKRRSVILLLIFGVAVFVPLVGQLFSLQILRHEELEQMAVDQQTRAVTVSAARGTIYDRNGSILSISASVETIFISPKELQENEEDIDLVARGLSEILDVEYATIVERAGKTQSQYQVIRTKVEKELADKVREFKNENDIIGIHLDPDTKRYYPYSTLASHVIGFVGTENTGLYGLEAMYEDTLQGDQGLIVTAKNGLGTDLLYKYEQIYDAEDGESLVLTIDATIQRYLEKTLAEASEEFRVANGAFGIVMDPNTGAILAMAGDPGYDLNNPSKIYDPDAAKALEGLEGDAYRSALGKAQLAQWRNRAVSDPYEPGSTFKALTLAMALEEDAVTESDHFNCTGSVMVPGWNSPIHCSNHNGHGMQTLAEATQHSCNPAFIKIGQSIGSKTFYDYAEAFGLLSPTGIDIQGEAGSLFFDKKNFTASGNLVSLSVASFGQTFKVTPIQLITAEAAVVNGGHLMQPYVVAETRDSEGNVLSSNSPKEVRQVISEETSARCRTILESVVSEGGGINAYVSGYRIGGKTGTADKMDDDSGQVIVSFMAFAPADDPEVILLLALDGPSRSTGTYVSGGAMVAPYAGELMSSILDYMGIEPDYAPEELSGADASVPPLTNLTLDQAIQRLTAAGFSYRMVGDGPMVTDQTPYSGAIVPQNAEIVLYLGAEKPLDLVKVPTVTGLTAEAANRKLAGLGLYMKATGAVSSYSQATVATGQSIDAGTEVEAGTVVTVQFTDSGILD